MFNVDTIINAAKKPTGTGIDEFIVIVVTERIYSPASFINKKGSALFLK